MTPEEQADALYFEVMHLLARYQLEFTLAHDTLTGVLSRAQFDLNAGSVEFIPEDDE
jgi:hypothetical protein